MPVKDIPHQNWPAFADAFGRQHQNWMARLEITSSENPGGAQGGTVEVKQFAELLPLRGFALERSADGESFWIALGDPPKDVMHKVAEPTKVEIRTEDDGAHEGLRIDCSGGEVLQLHFRAAAHPEELDGIA